MRVEELVVALGAPRELEADVGEHLVGVHVGRGAGAALVPVDLELVAVLAREDRLGRPLDELQLVLGAGRRRRCWPAPRRS